MTLNNIQYAAIMAVTLTVLLTSQSAYAETINVSSSTLGDRTISDVVAAANKGDTIIIADGDYHDQGRIVIKKVGVTLQSTNADHTQDDVKLIGNSTVLIRANDVTVAGLEFVETDPTHPRYKYGSVSLVQHNNKQSLSGIEIVKNSFTNTLGHGITLTGRVSDNIIHTDLNVSENTFSKIGFNVPEDEKPLFENGDKATNHDMNAITVRQVSNSTIKNNIIDETTWSGIDLNFVSDVTVKDNTISNVPKNGIIVARSPDSGVTITGNTIINAVFAESMVIEECLNGRGTCILQSANGTFVKLNMTSEKYVRDKVNAMADITSVTVTDNLRGAISVSSSTGVTIKDNIIKDTKIGVVLCPGVCDAASYKPYSDDRQPYLGRSGATVNENTFINATKAIINSVPSYVLDATRNYYSTEAPDFDALLYGIMQHSPFWTDKVGGVLKADGSAAIQFASAEVANKNFICSITLEKFNLTFEGASWGAVSTPAITNGVLNAGQQELTGVKLTSEGWKDSDGVIVKGARTLVDDAHLDFSGAAGIQRIAKDTAFPKPGTDEKLDFRFKLDLTERASGPDSEIYETVKYAGTCS